MKGAVNFGLLKCKIKEVYGNQEHFAEALGNSLQTVNNKLQGRCALTKDDIYNWSELLGIGKYDIPDYFFAEMYD